MYRRDLRTPETAVEDDRDRMRTRAGRNPVVELLIRVIAVAHRLRRPTTPSRGLPTFFLPF